LPPCWSTSPVGLAMRFAGGVELNVNNEELR
jgi:hypothetical protein